MDRPIFKVFIENIKSSLGSRQVEILDSNLPFFFPGTFSRSHLLKTHLTKETRTHIFGKEKLYNQFQDSGKVLKEVEQDVLKQDCSYRIKNFHKCSPFASYLVDLVTLQFNTNSTANLYFTPEGKQSLELHQDDYSVVILQITGKKKWYFKDTSMESKTGSMFYLPVGLPHKAIAIEDSYHISFSLRMPNIFSLLSAWAQKHEQRNDYTLQSAYPYKHTLEKITSHFTSNWDKVISEALEYYEYNNSLERAGKLDFYKNNNEFSPHEIHQINSDNILQVSFNPQLILIQKSDKTIKIKSVQHRILFEKIFLFSGKPTIQLFSKDKPMEDFVFTKVLFDNHIIRKSNLKAFI